MTPSLATQIPRTFEMSGRIVANLNTALSSE